MPSVEERLCQASPKESRFLTRPHCAQQKSTWHSIWESACTLCFSNKELEERRAKKYGETNRETGIKWGGEEVGGDLKRVWLAMVVEFLEVFWQFVSLFKKRVKPFLLSGQNLSPSQRVQLAVYLDVCQPHIQEEAKKKKKKRGKKTTAEERKGQ